MIPAASVIGYYGGVPILPTDPLPAMVPRLPVLALSLLVLLPAAAQDVIVHDEIFVREDGDPDKDADGVKNGVVVWRGGAVHVVWFGNRGRPSREGDSLVVQPGAIIKLSSTFKVDDEGELTEWRPVGSLNLCDTPQRAIRLEGVTITDIRDDEVGGDTNQDGGATEPGLNNSIFTCGADGDVFDGSTFRYVQVQSGGPVTFTQNSFHASSLRLEVGSTAEIVGNEFVGCMAIQVSRSDSYISGNTIEWEPEMCATVGALSSTTIGIGGADSRAIVTGNTITSPRAISTEFTDDPEHRFRGRISSNVLRNPDPTDSQSYGIGVFLQSETIVTGNDIAGYAMPITIRESFSSEYDDPFTDVGVQINHNRFSHPDLTSESVGTVRFAGNSSLRDTGFFLDMTENYWGHPTGPYDRRSSFGDGEYYERGRGYPVGDYIDYSPFTGGQALPDEIAIRVMPSDAPPLHQGEGVSFDVEVNRYRLESARTGRIVAVVEDDAGTVLATTRIDITDEKTSASLPALHLNVPNTPYLYVYATLDPDGDVESTDSNPFRFRVRQTADDVDLSVVFATAALGLYPKPIRGNEMSISASFGYTLTTSSPSANGSIEIRMQEREKATSTVVQTLQTVTLPAPPGKDMDAAAELAFTIPFRDVLDEPATELYGEILLKDDAGRVVVRRHKSFKIHEAATITNLQFEPAEFSSTGSRFFAMQSFATNAKPEGHLLYDLAIKTSNASGWQLAVKIDARDAEGEPYTSYDEVIAETDISISDPITHLGQVNMPDFTEIHPPARSLVVRARIISSSGVTVAHATTQVPVHHIASSDEQMLDQAAPDVFLLHAVHLVNIANSHDRAIVAAEIDEPYRPVATSGAGGPAKTADYDVWEFVPINRYWLTYGDFDEGSFDARVRFSYDPAIDFPSRPDFNEDSLVVAAFNPLSRELEALPSVLDKSASTVEADFSSFFETYVLASKSTVMVKTASDDPPNVPEAFTLAPNYPNPFNPRTTIAFRTPESAVVRLAVYDVLGREIARLVDAHLPAGSHRAVWDGTTASGEQAASGIYFIRMQAGPFEGIRSAVLMR